MIIGASSLHATINKMKYHVKRRLFFDKKIQHFSCPGLNENSVNELKYLDNLFQCGSLKKENGVVLWHDVINNSINKHRSNNYRPLGVTELVGVLMRNKQKLSCIIHSQRDGTPNIFEDLKSTGILVLDTKKFLSTRKRKDEWYKTEVAKVHPSLKLELKFLETIVKKLSSGKLQDLTRNRRLRKRTSKKRKQRRLP